MHFEPGTEKRVKKVDFHSANKVCHLARQNIPPPPTVVWLVIPAFFLLFFFDTPFDSSTCLSSRDRHYFWMSSTGLFHNKWWQEIITFKKWKWMELPLLYIFCCGGHFSMRKCIVFRDKFDVLCPQRAKRCNVLGSAVLLISLHSEIKKHICEHYVTWTNIEFWQRSGISWHSLFILF